MPQNKKQESNPAGLVAQSFQAVPRRHFLPKKIQYLAEADQALPIGYGQTISQPSTVRRMLEWLGAEPGQKILDIGSGSGWTSALLTHLAGTNGRVYAVEKVPELVAFGRENCEKLRLGNVEFHEADDVLGLPYHAPFQRILVSAAANTFPSQLLHQLAYGGKLVIPVRHDILEVTKHHSGEIETIPHGGFMFVPLVT